MKSTKSLALSLGYTFTEGEEYLFRENSMVDPIPCPLTPFPARNHIN